MASKQGRGKKDRDISLVEELSGAFEPDVVDGSDDDVEDDGDAAVMSISTLTGVDRNTVADIYSKANCDASKTIAVCNILVGGVPSQPIAPPCDEPAVPAKKKAPMSKLPCQLAMSTTGTPVSEQSPVSFSSDRVTPNLVSTASFDAERPDDEGYEVGRTDANWFYDLTNAQKAHALFWSYTELSKQKPAAASHLTKAFLKALSLDPKVTTKARDFSLRLFDNIDEMLVAVAALSRIVPEQYVDAYTMLKNLDDGVEISVDHNIVKRGEYEFDMSLSSIYVPTNKIVGVSSHVKVPKLNFDFLDQYEVKRGAIKYFADHYLRDVALLLTNVDGPNFGIRPFALNLGNGLPEMVSWKLSEATVRNLNKFSSSSKGLGDLYVQLVKFLVKNEIVPLVEYRSRKRLISTVLLEVFGSEADPRCYEVTDDKTHPTVLSILEAHRAMRKGTMLDLSLAKDVRPILCSYKTSVGNCYVALNHSVVQKGVPAFEKLKLCRPNTLIYGGVTADGGSNLQYSYFKQACEAKKIQFKAFDMHKSSNVDHVDAGNCEVVRAYVKAMGCESKIWVAHLDLSSHSVDVVVSAKMNETVINYATNFIKAGATMVTFKACLFAGLHSNYKVRWLTKKVGGKDYYIRGRAHAGEGVAIMYDITDNSNQFSCIALARSQDKLNSIGKEMLQDVCAANLRRGLKREVLSLDVPIQADPIISAFKPSALVQVTKINMETDDYDTYEGRVEPEVNPCPTPEVEEEL